MKQGDRIIGFLLAFFLIAGGIVLPFVDGINHTDIWVMGIAFYMGVTTLVDVFFPGDHK